MRYRTSTHARPRLRLRLAGTVAAALTLTALVVPAGAATGSLTIVADRPRRMTVRLPARPRCTSTR